MNEKEIIERLKESALEDVKYFSNANREERERWVVSEFLSIIGVKHSELELKSLEQHDKADVCFHDASFQVKELTDPNLKRGKMYKDIYASLNTATSLKEVSLIGDACDVPPIARMYELVLEMAIKYSNDEKYESEKTKLDLLIYITRTMAFPIQKHEIKREDFLGLGWRSVSCVNSKQAVVLYSSPTAPQFIADQSQMISS